MYWSGSTLCGYVIPVIRAYSNLFAPLNSYNPPSTSACILYGHISHYSRCFLLNRVGEINVSLGI